MNAFAFRFIHSRFGDKTLIIFQIRHSFHGTRNVLGPFSFVAFYDAG